jgi:hypothetical protein
MNKLAIRFLVVGVLSATFFIATARESVAGGPFFYGSGFYHPGPIYSYPVAPVYSYPAPAYSYPTVVQPAPVVVYNAAPVVPVFPGYGAYVYRPVPAAYGYYGGPVYGGGEVEVKMKYRHGRFQYKVEYDD